MKGVTRTKRTIQRMKMWVERRAGLRKMDQCRTATQSTTTITARQSDSLYCLDRRIQVGLIFWGRGVGGEVGVCETKTTGRLKKVNTVTHKKTKTQSDTFTYTQSGHSQKNDDVHYTKRQGHFISHCRLEMFYRQ